MKTVKHYLFAAAAFGLLAGDIEFAGQSIGIDLFDVIGEAQAIIGRPATPASYAGVARRTTRRVIRRGAYVAAIPAGCPYGVYYGYNLYYCGGTYYQKSGSGYVVVYF
jgi:hypothetical protein